MATTTNRRQERGQPDIKIGDGSGPANDVGMDSLVIQAAHVQSRFVPGFEAVRLASSLARRPRKVVRRAGSLGAELAQIARGASERKPPKGDRRFADPAWSDSWMFRRL